MTPLLLTACDPSGRIDLRLADLPADIRGCFEELTGRPAGTGALSQKQVVALIGRLRDSELRLSACGKRLIALYDAQAAALAKAGEP
ncbi:hypothetical protein V5F77_02320 [Xanthobacter sp. DSM 24535]|uniref:hypothetical protein n=1 Tax=Roseixanthobacter psychrophilus TaxID=3119917 RepID=UPI0037273877